MAASGFRSVGASAAKNGSIGFGKHKGKTFDEVASSDPGYCDWALKMDSPSAGLKDFVEFLKSRGGGAASAQSAGPAGNSLLEAAGTRLPEDILLVCELVQEDTFVVRAERKLQAAGGTGHAYVPPQVWHAIGALKGAVLSVDRRSWAFPVRNHRDVVPMLEGIGQVERIPNWVLQLMDKSKSAGDCVQEARLPEALLPYQHEGVTFGMGRRGRILIGDDMGLGKTLQALALAAQYKEDWPMLVVCPSSLRWVWKEQALQWLQGTISPAEVQVIKKGSDILSPDAKMWIVSYTLLASDAKRGNFQLRPDQQPHGVVICDESHNIKDWSTGKTKALVPILRKARRAMLLSGTPTRNSPDELHPQLCGLMPEICKLSDFRSRYCAIAQKSIHGGKTQVSQVVGARCAVELHCLLTATVMIRRLKKDVLSQLPEKRRQKVPLEIADTKLRGIRSDANGVDLFVGADAEDDKSVSNLFMKVAKAKLPAVKEYMFDLLDRGDEKAIVFAHHTLMLDEIEEVLAKQLHKDCLSYVRIDGKTPMNNRPVLVKKFQEDPRCRIALLSITACAEGLTLTAASLVIFAELYWVPGAIEQAEARAHRIGSTHSKVVVEFLVVPDSPDEHIYNSLERKKKDTSQVLDGVAESLNATKQLASRVRKRAAEEDQPAASPSSDADGSAEKFQKVMQSVAEKKRVAAKVKAEANASTPTSVDRSKAEETANKALDTPSPVDHRSKVQAMLRAARDGRKAFEKARSGT